MQFTAIDHQAIFTSQIQRLIDWYCGVLGMQVLASNGKSPPNVLLGYDREMGGGGAVPLTGATAPYAIKGWRPARGTVLELCYSKEAEPAPAGISSLAPGLRHLAFRVADLDRACEFLRAAGVQFLGPASAALGGGRLISFRDPEGNELQIVERDRS
jgi:glyoxylase I family protein